jgi:hypothetical protein
MSSGYKNLGCRHVGILALMASAGLVWGEVTPNPYQPIFERNVFALKDPPPLITAPPTNVPPPAPIAKVILTGIINVGGPRKALLEITETEGGKQSVKRPILREGEREGPVEVISINFEKGTVLARIGTLETNLNFEVQKMASAAPAAGGPPGRPSPGPIPSLPPSNAGVPPGVIPPKATASTEPNIIPRTPVGTPVDRSGIGLYGATPSAVGSPAPIIPAYAGGSYGGATYNSSINSGISVSSGIATGTTLASANNNVSTGTGIDTSRSIRTGTDTPVVNANPVSTWLNMRINEERAAKTSRPMPPTPPLPGAWGGQVPGGGSGN